MKKIITIIISICIIFSNALANEINVDNSLQYIIDAVSASSIVSEDLLDSSSENQINSVFYKNFISILSMYLNDQSLLTEKDKQNELLKNVFIDKIELPDNIIQCNQKEYIGAKIMSSKNYDDGSTKIIASLYKASNRIDKLDINQIPNLRWLDKRIVISLVKNRDSNFGYSISDFSLTAELAFEKEIEDYFQNNFIEYVNSNFGFTIQFPSSFENNIVEDKNGISSISKDQKANLQIKTFDNVDKWTGESYYNNLKSNNKENAELYKDMNIVTNMEVIDKDNLIYEIYLFSESNVYQATIKFDKSVFIEYSLNLEYIKNTFRVINNEIG